MIEDVESEGTKFKLKNIETGKIRMGHKFHMKKVEALPQTTIVPAEMEKKDKMTLRAHTKEQV